MKTTRINNMSSPASRLQKNLQDLHTAANTKEYKIPAGFWGKCDLGTLSAEEALDYLQYNSTVKYPVDSTMTITDNAPVVARLEPDSKREQQRLQIEHPESNGQKRVRLPVKDGETTLERIVKLAELGKTSVETETIIDNDIRKAYAGVRVNGQVFRVGTVMTNAIAIASALDGEPVFVVLPALEAEEG